MTGKLCGRCGNEIMASGALAATLMRAWVSLRDRRLMVPASAVTGLEAATKAQLCIAGLCGGDQGEP